MFSVVDLPFILCALEKAVAGRYVRTAGIIDCLAKGQSGDDGEIWFTDAIAKLTATAGVFAYRYAGHLYDCGIKFGLHKSSVYLAEHRHGVGQEFAAWLKAREDIMAHRNSSIPPLGGGNTPTTSQNSLGGGQWAHRLAFAMATQQSQMLRFLSFEK